MGHYTYFVTELGYPLTQRFYRRRTLTLNVEDIHHIHIYAWCSNWHLPLPLRGVSLSFSHINLHLYI